jgi:hypothetical protein
MALPKIFNVLMAKFHVVDEMENSSDIEFDRIADHVFRGEKTNPYQTQKDFMRDAETIHEETVKFIQTKATTLVTKMREIVQTTDIDYYPELSIDLIHTFKFYLDKTKPHALKFIGECEIIVGTTYGLTDLIGIEFMNIEYKGEADFHLFSEQIKVKTMKNKSTPQVTVNNHGPSTNQFGDNNIQHITIINQTIQTLEQQIKESDSSPEQRTKMQKTVDVLKGLAGFVADHGEGAVKAIQAISGQQA